jgi:hypothetical protein
MCGVAVANFSKVVVRAGGRRRGQQPPAPPPTPLLLGPPTILPLGIPTPLSLAKQLPTHLLMQVCVWRVQFRAVSLVLSRPQASPTGRHSIRGGPKVESSLRAAVQTWW